MERLTSWLFAYKNSNFRKTVSNMLAADRCVCNKYSIPAIDIMVVKIFLVFNITLAIFALWLIKIVI